MTLRKSQILGKEGPGMPLHQIRLLTSKLIRRQESGTWLRTDRQINTASKGSVHRQAALGGFEWLPHKDTQRPCKFSEPGD